MSKSEILASVTDELIALTPGEANDVAKKQPLTEDLPAESITVQDSVPFVTPAGKNQKALVQQLVDMIRGSAAIAPNTVGYESLDAKMKAILASALSDIASPMNAHYLFDPDEDGVAQFWKVSKTDGIAEYSASRKMYKHQTYIHSSQIIQTKNLPADPNEYITFSQNFFKTFVESSFWTEGFVYLTGAHPPENFEIQCNAALSMDGPFIPIGTATYTGAEIAQNERVRLVIPKFPNKEGIIQLLFKIWNTSSATAGEAGMQLSPFLLKLGNPVADGEITVLANNVVFPGARSLDFQGVTGKRESMGRVSLKVRPYSFYDSAGMEANFTGNELKFVTSEITQENPSDPESALEITPGIQFTDENKNTARGSSIQFEGGLSVSEGSGDLAGKVLISGSDSQISWEDPEERTSGTTSRIVTELGIKGREDPNNGALVLSVNPDIFALPEAPDYVAFLNSPEELFFNKGYDPDKHAIWFGDSLTPGNSQITSDVDSKDLEIEPQLDGKNRFYIFIYVVNFQGYALSDGYIRIFARDLSTVPGINLENYLYDIYGDPISLERQYKRGEELGRITLATVVEVHNAVSNFTLHIAQTVSPLLQFSEPVDAVSGFLLQSADGWGRGLNVFRDRTQFDLRWETVKIQNPIRSIQYVIRYDFPTTIVDAPETDYPDPFFFVQDGLNVVPVTKTAEFAVTGGTLVLTAGKDHTGAPAGGDAYLAYVLYGRETHALHGKKLKATAKVLKNSHDAELSFVEWRGTGDPAAAEEIILSTKSDVPQLGADWTITRTIPFVNSAQDHQKSLEGEVSFAARLFAVILRSREASQNLRIEVTQFDLEVEKPFTTVVLSSLLVDKTPKVPLIDSAKFIQDNQVFYSMNYTLSDHETPCPLGIRQKGYGLPVVLDPTLNAVPNSGAKGGEGCLKFTEDIDDCIVELQVTVEPMSGLPPIQTTSCYFQWYDVQQDGTFTERPDGKLDLSVKQDYPPVTGYMEIRGDFKKGARLALKMKAETTNWIQLNCVSKTKPMIITNVFKGQV